MSLGALCYGTGLAIAFPWTFVVLRLASGEQMAEAQSVWLTELAPAVPSR